MPLYAKTARNAHGHLRKEVKEEFRAEKPGPPEPEMPWRPISGYRTDWPMVPLRKTQARIPGVKRKGPVHKFLMNIPIREWNMLMTAAIDLEIPVALIVRFGYRRFLRSYVHAYRFNREGEIIRKVTAETLLSRAEIEVLGGQYRGPHKWRRKMEELQQTPPAPREGFRGPVEKAKTPPNPYPKGSTRRRVFIVPQQP